MHIYTTRLAISKDSRLIRVLLRRSIYCLETKFILLLAITFILCIQSARSQNLTLLKDINPKNSNYMATTPYEVGHLGNLVLFSMNDRDHGIELWSSDGTTSGTQMIKDINKGMGNSYPVFFTPFKNEVYFIAFDDAHGTSLWKTDGTEAGTKIVKDIIDGPGSASIAKLAATSNLLYFFTSVVPNYSQTQIWRTDGTKAGTMPVDTLSFDLGYLGNISDAIAVNDKIVFGAFGNNAGTYVTDGTLHGVTKLIDAAPVYAASNDRGAFVKLGDRVFFSGADENYNNKLYSTDGSPEGTSILYDDNTYELTEKGGFLYFDAFTMSGSQFFKSDGTVAGTKTYSKALSSQQHIFVDGSTIYFSGYDGYGYELWKTDGTDEGTVLIKDIESGSEGSFPDNFVKNNGIVYFQATTKNAGRELWKTDGTTQGTQLVKDIVSGPEGTSAYLVENSSNNAMFFANDGDDGGQLWKSNGADAGTIKIKKVEKPGESSYPWYLTPVNNKLFFIAENPVDGRGVYTTDGTPSGTAVVKNNSGSAFSAYGEMYPTSSSSIVFLGYDGTRDNFYSSDGATKGTTLIKQGSMIISGIGNIRDTSYYIQNDQYNQPELWMSNGTPDGTHAIKSLGARQSSYSYSSFHASTSKELLFVNNEANTGTELWKTDGTDFGTRLVKDINPGEGASNITDLFVFGQKVIFSADNGLSGIEPWISDGTEAGTFMLKDINAGLENSVPTSFAIYNNEAYFLAFSGQSDYALWKTNGTKEGTVKVKELGHNVGFSQFFSMVSFQNNLFFSAEDSEHGVELWQINADGLHLFADLLPGSDGSYPWNMFVTENKMFFTAINSNEKRVNWVFDGTVAKQLVFSPEVILGAIAYIDNHYVGIGTSAITGTEIYALDFTNEVTATPEETSTKVTLYPNPTEGTVTVRGFANEQASISVTDCSGHRVLSANETASHDLLTFNISTLPTGIYIVKVKSLSREVTKKIVKK